jgi:diguanylate cyclase (GGDEF)-like protein
VKNLPKSKRSRLARQTVNSKQYRLLLSSVTWFKEHHIPQRYDILVKQLTGIFSIDTLNELSSGINYLYEEMVNYRFRFLLDENKSTDLNIRDDALPTLKRVIAEMRRAEANKVDIERRKTHHPKLIKNLDDRVRQFDEILTLDWLEPVDLTPLPKLADFLSTELIDQHFSMDQLPSREFDEKFRILQAPKLFIQDLHYFRVLCGNRNLSVSAAYIDIDDFKKLNSKYGEVEIDRRVLWRFMQLLSEQTFQHGFAYRYGGDEYALLIPNFTKPLTIEFIEELRLRVQELRYDGIKERITISIGLCCVDPDCYLTDLEVESRANTAKSFAKGNGKNCIATYATSEFTEEGLSIVGR